MSHTEINESDDGTIEVTEKPDSEEREAEALEQLVTDIRNDPDATTSEKRLASALVALKNTQS